MKTKRDHSQLIHCIRQTLSGNFDENIASRDDNNDHCSSTKMFVISKKNWIKHNDIHFNVARAVVYTGRSKGGGAKSRDTPDVIRDVEGKGKTSAAAASSDNLSDCVKG